MSVAEMERVKVDALGTAVCFEVPAEHARGLAAQWSRCPVRTEPRVAVRVDDDPALGRTWQSRLTAAATLAGIMGSATRLNLHAAGLAADDGTVLALVAPSGTGKTTAASRLGLEFGYVTDECVSVCDDGTVISFPKPLLMRRADDLPKQQVGPDELGLRSLPERLSLGPVVVLSRDGTTSPRLEPLDPLAAVLALIPHVSALARRPSPINELTELCLRRSVGLLRYAEIDQAAALLRDLLHAPQARLPTAKHLHIPGEGKRTATGVRPGTGPCEPLKGSFARATWNDAVMLDGRALVLRGVQPYLLAGVGAAVWLEVGKPCDLDTLEARVVARLGLIADSASRVRRGAQALLASGLIEML